MKDLLEGKGKELNVKRRLQGKASSGGKKANKGPKKANKDPNLFWI